MTTPIDQLERDAIVTRIDRNACVEASAGTGKTTVLVDRIVTLLRTGAVTIEELAVITFTEKAAAELSVRVRQQLESALADGDGVERDRLDAALAGLHRAHIETIHAFCGGLLRERPVEAGLDPLFEVTDQLGSSLDFDVAYERWLTGLLDQDDERVALALNRGMRLDHFRELAEILNEHRAVLPLAPVFAPDADLAAFRRELRQISNDLEHLRSTFDLPEGDPGVAQLPAVERAVQRLYEAGADDLELARLLIDPARLKPGLGAQKHWDDKAGCQLMKGTVRRLCEKSEDASQTLRTHALVALMPLVGEFVQAFAEERRRAGRLTFDDLLLWARDLVADHPDVREDFRRQYRALLVDEFQDTDPVQAELVLHLTSDGPETDPLKLQPAPGRLVVVGDPKQSIYRFRRADIAIYDRVKRGPLADDLLQIRQNFRSVDGVLRWANGVFDRVLVESPGKQPGNVPLEPTGESIGNDLPSVAVVFGPTLEDGEKLSADARRTEEARTLAAALAKARADGLPVRDRQTGELRSARWRDMAILVPARTGVSTFEEEFAAAGVPLRHEGGKTFFRRQEVRELVSCLHAIDDPTDRISLVATLRSPVFGCSDEELLLWTAAGGKWTYYGGLVEGSGGPDRVRAGLLQLRGLHRVRTSLSLPVLVRRVLDETGAVEHALTGFQGRETAANLLKLVDQARDFSASGGGGLRAFTRWLARNRDEDSEETDAGISEETDDVVRLLTIHAAKGLEFPIVALANLASAGAAQFRPIPEPDRHRIHLRIGTSTKGGWYETPDLEAAKEDEKVLTELERLRLLYVGVTRARDHLVIPRIDEPKHLLASLASGLPTPTASAVEAAAKGTRIVDREGLIFPREAPGAAAPAIEVSTDATSEAEQDATLWASDQEKLIDEASVELTVHTATSLEKPWRPMLATAESTDATLILGEGPPLPLGDALHRVMELVAWPQGEDLEAVATAVCAEAELEGSTTEVIALAKRCLASRSVVAARSADQVVRELPFVVEGPAGDGYVTGRIDLAYRVGSDWTVVDYKTDTVADGDLAKAGAIHGVQISAYAEAMRAVTGVVPKVVLVFARGGASAEFEVG